MLCADVSSDSARCHIPYAHGSASSEELVTLRVFVVEDQGRMRALFKDLFEQLEGASVVAATATEAEACLWLAEHPREWDLAIIDLILEQGSGMGVISKCKASPRPGNIVVFSSYATPGVRKH